MKYRHCFITAVMLLCSMYCAFLTSCNQRNTSEVSATSLIGSSTTAEPTVSKMYDEYEFSDYWSEDLLSELHKDKIEYSVQYLEGKQSVYLPFEIDKYADSDNFTFDLELLLRDYGWIENDGSFYYDVDDLRIVMTFCEEEKTLGNVIKEIDYDFVFSANPDENYYYFVDGLSPTNNSKVVFYYESECDYSVTGLDNCYVSYEDCITISYIVSWVSVRPQTCPLSYLPNLYQYSFDDHDSYSVRINPNY